MSAPSISPELRDALAGWSAAWKGASIAIARLARQGGSAIEVAIVTAKWSELARFIGAEDLENPVDLLAEARAKTAALEELGGAIRAQLLAVN